MITAIPELVFDTDVYIFVDAAHHPLIIIITTKIKYNVYLI